MKRALNIMMEVGPGDADWVEETFRDIPVGTCFCLARYEEYIPKINCETMIWYSGKQIDSVDANTLRPLDEELIESMRDCEAIYLNMLNRIFWKKTATYQHRKREYLQCLRYWNHMFNEVGIDLFIANDIPHHGFTYIPYTLSKRHNTARIFCSNMRLIRDALFLVDDWENSTPDLPIIFEKLRQQHPDGNIELPERFEQYYASQTEKSVDPTPWHMKGKGVARLPHDPLFGPSHIPNKVLPFVRDAILFLPRRLKPSYWRRHLRERARITAANQMFDYYEQSATPPDLTKRFVYMPLHMQPECTTAPLAGAFVDQLLIAQMLSAYLPDDVLIYVKEHPDQGARRCDLNCRSTDFYRDLVACEKVRLVPRTFSTFDLMEKAEAIATATGSPGFEALFRGKCVFMFGHRFFQHAPGVFTIHMKEDCKKAVTEIFEKKVKPTLSDLRLFLKALSEIVIPGAVNPVDRQHSDNAPEENARIVGRALAERIKAKCDLNDSAPTETSSKTPQKTIHRMLVSA